MIPHIIHLEEVDSTNSYAENLLKTKSVEEGTIIVAEKQTAGKGQGDHVWLSEPGKNLTFTLILHPEFIKAEDQFTINMMVALGIVDFLKNLIPKEDFKIKWPNDIYWNQRKLGGVLINHFISGSKLEHTIVGIGLNVNQVEFNSQLPNPVSLKQINEGPFDLKLLLTDLCEAIAKRYTSTEACAHEELKKSYLEIVLGNGKLRSYKMHNQMLQATIKDVDRFGRLILLTSQQEILTCSFGEIEFVFE